MNQEQGLTRSTHSYVLRVSQFLPLGELQTHWLTCSESNGEVRIWSQICLTPRLRFFPLYQQFPNTSSWTWTSSKLSYKLSEQNEKYEDNVVSFFLKQNEFSLKHCPFSEITAHFWCLKCSFSYEMIVVMMVIICFWVVFVFQCPLFCFCFSMSLPDKI